MQQTISRFLMTFIAGAILALPVMADDTAQAAERIKQRLAQVDQLKAAGSVGEDAKGFLVERTPLSGRKASIVSSENADRRVIYAATAMKTGQSAEQVGAQRALQIAERARPGVWLQKPSGEWYQKP
jgi:uncharacterized protein YdbL (DUF1318 family)